MSYLVVIAALVALVWSAVFMFRGSLVLGALGFLVLCVCFGHPFFHAELGPIPVTLDRLFLLLLLAAYAVQRHAGLTDPKPLATPDVVLWAFFGLLLVSGSAAGWAGTPTEPSVTVWRLVGGYLIPWALYWIVRQAPLGERQVSQVHLALAVMGIYLGITGILETTGQWWAVFPTHIADPKLGLHFGRARGPMIHAVSYGLYVAVCLLTIWIAAWWSGTRGRVVALIGLPLTLVGLVLSYTRSVWIGAALGLVIALAFTLRGKWRTLVLGSMLVVGLIGGVTRMESLTSMQREDSAEDSRKSVGMRATFTYVSWKMFLDRPLFGFGFGQFYTAKLDYLDDRSTALEMEQIRNFVHHNTFLSLLTETGLVGLSLYLALLAGWARTAWRLARSSTAPEWARAQGMLLLCVLAVYVTLALFHELSYTPIDNSLVFMLAGLTMGLAPLATRSQPAGIPAVERRPTLLQFPTPHPAE
jgi:O-antigen ligase